MNKFPQRKLAETALKLFRSTRTNHLGDLKLSRVIQRKSLMKAKCCRKNRRLCRKIRRILWKCINKRDQKRKKPLSWPKNSNKRRKIRKRDWKDRGQIWKVKMRLMPRVLPLQHFHIARQTVWVLKGLKLLKSSARSKNRKTKNNLLMTIWMSNWRQAKMKSIVLGPWRVDDRILPMLRYSVKGASVMWLQKKISTRRNTL